MNWTSLWQSVVMGLILFGIGYLMPVKSPFDEDCPEPKPVSVNTTHDSSAITIPSVQVESAHTNVKPTVGWHYTSVTQDTLGGQLVDIIAKEKYWSYIDTLIDTTDNFIVRSMPEVIISGLINDTISVDILQNIEVEPKPVYVPVDTTYIINTVSVPAKPEDPTVWESPLFWGAVGITIGMILGSIVNKNNMVVVDEFNDLGRE